MGNLRRDIFKLSRWYTLVLWEPAPNWRALVDARPRKRKKKKKTADNGHNRMKTNDSTMNSQKCVVVKTGSAKRRTLKHSEPWVDVRSIEFASFSSSFYCLSTVHGWTIREPVVDDSLPAHPFQVYRNGFFFGADRRELAVAIIFAAIFLSSCLTFNSVFFVVCYSSWLHYNWRLYDTHRQRCADNGDLWRHFGNSAPRHCRQRPQRIRIVIATRATFLKCSSSQDNGRKQRKPRQQQGQAHYQCKTLRPPKPNLKANFSLILNKYFLSGLALVSLFVCRTWVI